MQIIIYILPIEATGENKYDLDMEKYMKMSVCPSYKIEDFFNEIYYQNLTPEMMFSKYNQLAQKTMKENLIKQKLAQKSMKESLTKKKLARD